MTAPNFLTVLLQVLQADTDQGEMKGDYLVSSKKGYKFPKKKDVTWVLALEITEILPVPAERNGIFNFKYQQFMK